MCSACIPSMPGFTFRETSCVRYASESARFLVVRSLNVSRKNVSLSHSHSRGCSADAPSLRGDCSATRMRPASRRRWQGRPPGVAQPSLRAAEERGLLYLCGGGTQGDEYRSAPLDVRRARDSGRERDRICSPDAPAHDASTFCWVSAAHGEVVVADSGCLPRPRPPRRSNPASCAPFRRPAEGLTRVERPPTGFS